MFTVYTAMSKKLFYLREHISRYVLLKGYLPINPFMIFGYYLTNTVPRATIREANTSLLISCRELWSFGEISNGMEKEIDLAKSMKSYIRFFEVISDYPFKLQEIEEKEVNFEQTV